MHSANGVYQLADTEMEVHNRIHGCYWSKFHATVTMRLSPVPRVSIQAHFDIPSSLLDHGKTVMVRLPHGPEIEVQVTECHIGAELRSRLVPTRQPVTVVQKEEDLHRVDFKVINYPSLVDRSRPALLRSGPWLIELTPCSDLKESKSILTSDSGFALTHEGCIQRTDTKHFSVEEAEGILSALHLMLSFARGGSCGLTFVIGSDKKGEKIWERWGSYSAYPWFQLTSWMDHRHNNEKTLSQAWPGFLKMCRKPREESNDPFRVALYWYLRSNEANNPYVGIVLTQAALERLAEEIANMRGLKSTTSREAVCAAVEHVGLDLAIPPSCGELRAIYRDDVDGPTTLRKIRNNLVHPRMSEDVGLDAFTQARHLGQWYVELFLLRLIEYEGEYANRLAYGYEGIWATESVPWSRG